VKRSHLFFTSAQGGEVSRRAALTVLGGAALAWPLAARAQQAAVKRVGVLMTLAADDPETKARMVAFQQQLERLGWSDGRNVKIEYRFEAGRSDRILSLAQEMVASQPEVIVATGSPVASAVRRETLAIPIVFVGVSDPIGAGLVKNLARPGGNVSGVLLYEDGIIGKWLAMLKEIAPLLTRVALLANPKTTAFEYYLRAAQAAAAPLALELVSTPIAADADIERVMASFAATPNGGLLVPPDPATITLRDVIVALAARYRLPAVYPFRSFVDAGGLMCYDTDALDSHRLAATYVDRILRGAKPADLPVQAPTKYETVVNLKTAKAIGLDVPASILVRADQVIE
jgi:putative tryptophan/tyrosine transport system substrate-binding protein